VGRFGAPPELITVFSFTRPRWSRSPPKNLLCMTRARGSRMPRPSRRARRPPRARQGRDRPSAAALPALRVPSRPECCGSDSAFGVPPSAFWPGLRQPRGRPRNPPASRPAPARRQAGSATEGAIRGRFGFRVTAAAVPTRLAHAWA